MNHQTRTALFISGTIALFSLVLFVGVFYLIYAKSAEITTIENDLASAEAWENSSVSVKRLLVDTRDARNKIDSYFIGSDNVVSFIESIESLSKFVNVDTNVNTVGIDQISDTSKFEYATLSAVSEGSFQNLYWLLSLIETMPYELEVRRVYLEQLPPDPKTKTIRWRLAFEVRALKLK